MRNFADYISHLLGYADSNSFVKGVFHPDFTEQIGPISIVLSCIAYYFYATFGVQLPVFVVVLIFFFVEMRTGIKVSKQNGTSKGWESKLAQKGFGKFGLYWIMIGCAHILDVYIPTEEFFYLVEFDVYKWIHFLAYNYVILIYIGSIIENLIHLGYDKRGRVTGWIVRTIAKIYRIKIDKIIGDDDGK